MFLCSTTAGNDLKNNTDSHFRSEFYEPCNCVSSWVLFMLSLYFLSSVVFMNLY